MNSSNIPEIKPGMKLIKRIYIFIMLLVVGRAIQAASKVDSVVKEEFKNMRDDFAFVLGVLPNGPFMVVEKDKNGHAKYCGWNPKGKKLTLKMYIKNTEAAMRVFTFRESTTMAFARNRYIVDGNLTDGLAVVRVLDLVEVYLLPKLIAKLAVKRYPKWSEMSPLRKYTGRVLVYLRLITG
jgi:hypothetical protein